MAKRNSRFNGPVAGFLKWGAIAFALVTGGYLWRSYAPLPISWDARLAGGDPTTPEETKRELQLARARAARAEGELEKLQGTILKNNRHVVASEATMADARVKDILKP